MTEKEMIEELLASHRNILALIEKVEASITPVLNDLKNSPIGKMMGVK